MADLPPGRPLRAVLLGLLAAGALAAGLLVGAGGATEPAPAGATLRLVPARALVVVHLATDRRRAGWGRAGELVARLPSWPRLRRDLLRRLEAPGCGVDLEERPGREVTLALLRDRAGGSQPLLLTDAPAAGVGELPAPCGALVARRVGGLVAIGEPDAVLAAQALADGRGRSLAEDPAYRAAARGLPAARVADAWVSAAGARRLLAPLGGALGTAGRLLDAPGLRGAALALVPRDEAARVVVRRVLARPRRAPAFTPTLQERAPREAIAYVASGDLAGALQGLLVLAGGDAADAVGSLLRRGGTSLDALGDLGRESAVVVGPSPEGPAVTVLSRMRDPRRARAAMAGVEPALARALGAPPGVGWGDARLAGRPARTIVVAPGRELTWVLEGDVLAVSTARAALAVPGRGGGLASSPAFRRTAGTLPRRVTSLVFLEPNQVLRLGEGTGQGPGAALGGVRADLARVRALGAHVTGGGTVSTVELSLWIP